MKAGENLSSMELALIADFLRDYSDECIDHSCNDFYCPATQENKAIVIAAIAHRGPDESQRDELLALLEEARDQVFIFDDWMMAYLAFRCQGLADEPEAFPPLAPAELNIIADSLGLPAGEREEDLSQGYEVEFTLPASGENKAFLAAVVKHRADAGWEKTVTEMMTSSDEVSTLDFWVMRYLQSRCVSLARGRQA